MQNGVKHSRNQEKSGAEQFIAAAAAPPTRFKSRLHHSRFQEPTARKDAEESERQRWLQLLANLLVGTDTPMGKLLQARQGDITVLGAGRRAGTIRSRVRNIRHFLAWLAINQAVTYPTDQSHLTDFLQVRLSEPCNRGSLKITHESLIFLGIVSGIEAQSRISASQLYLIIYHEPLTQSSSWQAYQTSTENVYGMLRGPEQLIMSNSAPLYFRIYAWLILVQSWATPVHCLRG